MRQESEFKFRTSISREGYADKKTAKMCLASITAKKIDREKMAFKEQEVTIKEFLSYAVKGYAFCNLFEFDANKEYWIKSGERFSKTKPVYQKGENKGYFKLSFKADEFFKGTQTIFVDVDYTHFKSMTDYVESLTYKPTCGYYSYSDNADKNGVISRRFRLVYVFDSILSLQRFRDITLSIYDAIVKDTQEDMEDMCGCSCSQYMNGGNSQEVYNSSIIYSDTDFPEYTETTTDEPQQLPDALIPVKESETPMFNEEMVHDMTYAPYEFVIRKWYHKGMNYFTRTVIEFGDNFYTMVDDDFVSLIYNRETIKDGNHRRRKLFVRAALRRLMKQDLTADELLYNLYIDRQKFFDNTDEVLTIELLQKKVKSAMEADIEEIKELAKCYRNPKFVINPSVSKADIHKAVGEARRNITNTLIGEFYDVNATVETNRVTMMENGFKVSTARLYQFCKAYNIQTVKSTTRTKKPVVEGYNPNLSIRENMVAMGGITMHQVLKAKEEYIKTHTLSQLSTTILSEVEK